MSKNEFAKFQLNSFLLEKLDQRKITKPTKIQEEVIPKLLKGEDIIAQSKTGTGKTLSYLLPLIESQIKHKSSSCLIIAPTKELARQIYEEAVYYAEGQNMPLPVLLIPGKELKKQLNELKKNHSFVIGVPGRILKANEIGALKLSFIKKLILDEADFLIDLGFIGDLRKIFQLTKNREQLLIFSATLSAQTKKVIDLAHYQNQASRVDKNELPSSIENLFYPIENDLEREKTLFKLLKGINPFLSIIFTRTREESEHIYDILKRNGENVSLLNGNLQAGQRKKIIQDFKKAKVQYLVATDLASRGLDVEGITHIINFTLPHNELDYIHRAGRTGRMGKNGVVISICNKLDEGYLKKYCYRIQIPLQAIKINNERIEIDKTYKGTKPRFNLNELKSMEKIQQAKKIKKEKENAFEKRRNQRK